MSLSTDRQALLDQLRKEREERRAAELQGTASAGLPQADSTADEAQAAEQRRAERTALVQRLLSERQGSQPQPPSPVRMAWEDRMERHTTRIEAELRKAGSQPGSPTRTAGVVRVGGATADEATWRGEPTDAAMLRAARDRAALESDARDLGALGAAELSALGDRATEELSRLSAAAVAKLGMADGMPSGVPAPPPPPSGVPAPPPPPPPAAARSSAGSASTARHPAGGGGRPSEGSAIKPAVTKSSIPRSRRSLGGAAGGGAAGGASSGGGAERGAGEAGAGPALKGASVRTPRSSLGGRGADGKPKESAREAAESACTFQPRINERSARLAEKYAEKHGGGSVTSRLATQRAESYAKRELQRMELEKAKLAECTFAPQINKSNSPAGPAAARALYAADESTAGGTTGRPVSAGERLHNDADRRLEMRERSRVASERWEVSSHSFAPHINPTSSVLASESSAARPIHERVDELQRKKEEKLQMLRMQLADEEDATFTPAINATSATLAIAANANSSGAMPMELSGRFGSHSASALSFSGDRQSSAAERLAHDASLALERRAQRELQRREAEGMACSFKPQINALSERMVAEAEASGDAPVGVLERLKLHEERVERKRQQRQHDAAEAERGLFQPTTSQANDILLQARAARMNESELERTERLAYVDGKRRDALRQQLENAHYSQFSHKPQIDSISAKLARSKTHAELSSNPHGKALKMELKKKREQEALAECTFKPTLDPHSKAIATAVPERIPHRPDLSEELTLRLAAEAREKAARLEAARRQVEAERLKECTFQPQVSPGERGHSVADEKPLVVRGLGRYMELKQLAKRQAEAQKQREQKAFILEPPARLQPYTVPEEFRFSQTSRREEKAEQVLHEANASRYAECTFKPRINEANVEALLRESREHELRAHGA